MDINPYAAPLSECRRSADPTRAAKPLAAPAVSVAILLGLQLWWLYAFAFSAAAKPYLGLA